MNDEQVMHAMGIDDAYRVERVLAQGAGGVTELVTLDGSGPFVRKRIPSKLARRGVWATLVECDCARLPHVEATYEMPDEFVVVCDYVPGENLEQLVAARGRFAEKDARELALQLCEAVGALHAHGIVHRDISPTNVIVAADGAHLIDLGIARFRVEGATRDTTQLGTFGFASPEQYGFAQTDARSDVYSLGRVLGYLLTGVSPSDAEKYEAALADPALVSAAMRRVVARATAMEPSARYQSAEELARSLEGEGVPERASLPEDGPAADAAPRRGSRRKVLIALVAVLVVAVAALVAYGVSAAGEKDEAPTPVASPVDETDEDDATDPSGDSWGVATGDAPESASTDVLEIVESGWSVDEQGYVHYGIALRNDGDAIVEFPTFTITGRDTEGKVLFSQDQTLSIIGPGETVYWGSLAGDAGMAPATVEFAPVRVEDYQLMASGDVPSFTVSGANVVEDSFGGTSFTGEVTTVRDGSAVGGDVALAVVLRDDSGAIVFGSVGFANRPAVGETTTFEISTYGDVPDYASFEVHAIAW